MRIKIQDRDPPIDPPIDPPTARSSKAAADGGSPASYLFSSKNFWNSNRSSKIHGSKNQLEALVERSAAPRRRGGPGSYLFESKNLLMVDGSGDFARSKSKTEHLASRRREEPSSYLSTSRNFQALILYFSCANLKFSFQNAWARIFGDTYLGPCLIWSGAKSTKPPTHTPWLHNFCAKSSAGIPQEYCVNTARILHISSEYVQFTARKLHQSCTSRWRIVWEYYGNTAEILRKYCSVSPETLAFSVL